MKLWQGDASFPPLDDDSVDGVFMSFTLELFDTPEIPRVLAECRRVLVPGGRLGVASISKGQHGDPMVRPIHARQALEASGFTIVSAGLQHMWLPVEIVLGRN